MIPTPCRVVPDWESSSRCPPVPFILVGVLLWLVMTVRAYAVLGPRERGRRYIAVPPAGLHAPGPSLRAGPRPGPGGSSAGPGTPTVTRDGRIKASGTAFTTPAISGPAGKAFTIAFDNEDQGIPHNVNIKNADGSDAFKGEIVTGPVTKIYQVPALPAGTYPFVCDVHPTMTGTLTVK